MTRGEVAATLGIFLILAAVQSVAGVPGVLITLVGTAIYGVIRVSRGAKAELNSSATAYRRPTTRPTATGRYAPRTR